MAVSKGRFAAAGLAAVAIAVAAWVWVGEVRDKPPLGLFTSLPIYWNEPGSVTEALDGAGAKHWVRGALEDHYRLVPLDTLDDTELARLRALVMAQPRPLTPSENVALDHWVRNGGRLLLFADPFLTEPSRFALGDKRRPQDVVLLSPILARWGLELTFDEDQPDDERTVEYGSERLPERLAGHFRSVQTTAPARCAITARMLVAECQIGSGHVVLVADAALLEADRSSDAGAPALSALEQRAFGP